MSDAAEKRRAYNMESRGYTRSPTGKKETLLRGPETYAIACRTNAFVSIKTESLSLHLGVIPAGCTYQSGNRPTSTAGEERRCASAVAGRYFFSTTPPEVP